MRERERAEGRPEGESSASIQTGFTLGCTDRSAGTSVYVSVCLRRFAAVGVGSSGACMSLSCIDSDVHSCFEL